MNALLSNVGLLLRNTRRSLVYGSIAVITVGLEELFEKVVFNCPCQGHLAYGLAFLWIPALLLFLCGILLDRDIWKPSRKEKGNKKATKEGIEKYSRKVFLTLDVTVRAALAPSAWLVLSFLQEQYYACAFFGPPLDDSGHSEVLSNMTQACRSEPGFRTKELEEMYRTRSQMAGWSIMLMAMSVLFVSLFIRRCKKRKRKLKIPSIEYYGHVEAKEALRIFHEKAREIARKEIEKDIELLFKNSTNSAFLPRVQEVSTTLNQKYGQYFVIPPESPAFWSPESAEPPQFSSIPGELMSDGPETTAHDQEMHLRRVPLVKSSSIENV